MNKKKICIGVVIMMSISICVLMYLKIRGVEIADSNANNLQNTIVTTRYDNSEKDNIDETNTLNEETDFSNVEVSRSENTSTQNQTMQEDKTDEITKEPKPVEKTEKKIEEQSIEKTIEKATEKVDEKVAQVPVQIHKQKSIQPVQPTPTTQVVEKTITEVQQQTQVQKTDDKKSNTQSKAQSNTPINANTENKQTKQMMQQDVTKYVENTTMIEKIKKVIKTNETQDMKQYGYNIETVASIVDSTNEFTFTEQRVKEKIRYKFGTIKIYARDYYKNGVFQYTQCFII